jgi:cysteine-rich repeat protein
LAIFTATFSETVVFNGLLTGTPATLDLDFRVRDDNGFTVLTEASGEAGQEVIQSGPFPAGVYTLEVFPYANGLYDLLTFELNILLEAPAVCGNGALEIGEECDDNNTNTMDGCDDACDVETGFVCDLDVEPTACHPVVCGDGERELGEECDDNNTNNADGCDENCDIEFGFVCSEPDMGMQTSTCVPHPDLGAFAAGDVIPETVGGPLANGGRDFYVITFTENVYLSGTLVVTDPATGGDVDFAVYDEDGLVFSEVTFTNTGEVWTDEPLAAGTYVLRVAAYDDAVAYSLSMSTTAGGVCNDGVFDEGFGEECDDGNMTNDDGCDNSCQTQVGYECDTSANPTVCVAYPDLGTLNHGQSAMTTGGALDENGDDEDFYAITLAELSVVEITVDSDDDADLNVQFIGPNGETQFTGSSLVDPEVVTGVGFPGTSVIRTYLSFSATGTTGYSLSVSATAPTDHGSYLAGDAIADITGGPIAQGALDYYVIEFLEAVELSGVLDAGETGAGTDDPDIDITIANENGTVFSSISTADPDSWGPTSLDAGVYVIRIRGYEAADTYTLSLTTTAP